MNDRERQLREEIFAKVREFYQLKHAPKPAFEPGVTPVRYAGRFFDDDELVKLVDSSLDFWLTAGRYAEEFEMDFAEYLDVENCLLVNSGSSANLLAISALTSPKLGDRRIAPGDEVITVAAGFPTTINPIVQNGAVPVFIDVNLGTYTAIPERIADAVGPRTKAIIMAHTMGVPYDLDVAKAVAKEHNLWLIEDNCDAVGSTYDGKMTGSIGDLGTISFYPAHHMTMGEGGAVVSSSEILDRLVRSFRDWGRDCYCGPGENNTCGVRFSQQFGDLPYGFDHKYVASHIGYNLKVTDMQAAIGVAQLQKLPDFVEARKRNHAQLHARLKPYEDKLVLHEATAKSDPSWFGYVLTVRDDAGFHRSDIVSFLEEKKVETRNLFSGNILLHPAYKEVQHRVVGDLYNSNRITRETFFVGVYPGMTEEMISYMGDCFDAFFAGRK